MICLPVGPRCDVCLLAKAKLCPSRVGNVKSEGRKEVVFTFTDPEDESKNGIDGESSGRSTIKVEYETLPETSTSSVGVKIETDGSATPSPIAEIKPEPESPTTTRIRVVQTPSTSQNTASAGGDDKTGLPSGHGVYAAETEDEPVINEEGVLDILDQVDGTKEIGDTTSS